MEYDYKWCMLAVVMMVMMVIMKVMLVVMVVMKMKMMMVVTTIRYCGQSFVSAAGSLVTRSDQSRSLHTILQLADHEDDCKPAKYIDLQSIINSTLVSPRTLVPLYLSSATVP